MALDYLPNCGTQLERAIRALFVTSGAAGGSDCFISNDSGTREINPAGTTSIIASNSMHEPEGSGNEVWQVNIFNKFGAATQPGAPSPGYNRIQLDKLVGRQALLMLQGYDDGSHILIPTTQAISAAGRALAIALDDSEKAVQLAADNEDMPEFTCLFVRFLGSNRGAPDDASCAWVEQRRYAISACPSNVD